MQLKTLKSSLLKQPRYPFFITIVFFAVISYLTIFHNDFLKEGDFFQYFLIGKEILDGNGTNVVALNANPGGPILYASLDKVFHDPLIVAKILGLFGGTGIVFVSYYVMRNIFGSKVALIGQLFIAFNPKIILISIGALNEILPVLFIFIAFYFITKKNILSNDVILCGVFLGLATMIRIQPILILIAFSIFLIFHSKKIQKNFCYVGLLVVFFLITVSPVLAYNYNTHGVFIDSNPNYNYLNVSKYTTPEWIEKLKFNIITNQDYTILDYPELFLKNYSYNLFYNNQDLFLNFGKMTSLSIIPTLPFVVLIPFLGGLFYLMKFRLDKINILVLSSTSLLSVFLLFLLGDPSIHFFIVIAIPTIALTLINIRNFQKNLLPLLISIFIFFTLISIIPLSRPEHLLPIWLIIPSLCAVFFVNTIPKILSKLSSSKKEVSISSQTKKIIIISVILVLLINVGHSYKSVELYLYENNYDGIVNEFSKFFQQSEPNIQKGQEIKKISDILSVQENIADSYVMAPMTGFLYYVDTNIILVTFQEGKKGDSFEQFYKRENWSEFDLLMSNVNSYPADRYGKNNPIPNYLIYGNPPIMNWKHDIRSTQYDDLKILYDPNNPDIPSNFEFIYKSDKLGLILYKIHHIP